MTTPDPVLEHEVTAQERSVDDQQDAQ